MSLTLGLSAALSGLAAAQRGLDNVSHNIANLNTPGYSRKIFSQKSRVLTAHGAGVTVTASSRNVDGLLRAELNRALSLSEQHSVNHDYNQRVQTTFGKPGDNTAVAHLINEFSQSLEQLALASSSSTQAGQTIMKARELQERLNAQSRFIQQQRGVADAEIGAAAVKINGLLQNIHDLSDKIVVAKATGRSAADLQDSRDLAMQQLSALLDVSYVEDPKGSVVIFTQSGISLLDSKARNIEFSPVSSLDPWRTKDSQQLAPLTVAGIDITSDIRSGQLKALIEQRDRTLPNLQAQLDELAFHLRDAINQAANRGVSHPAMASSMTGSRVFIKTAGVATQRFAVTKGDIAITMFKKDGSQAATITLSALMGGTAAGTIDEFASKLQTWLRANGAANASATVDADGKMDIQLNTSSLSLGFRDQVAPTLGAAREDTTVAFDANADGTTDQTVKGFSHFLGLNNVFEKRGDNWLWDSQSLPEDYRNTGSATRYSFSSATRGLNFGAVTILPGDTAQMIAERVNSDPNLADKVVASVVHDASGQRVRFANQDGSELDVSVVSGSGQPLGIAPSKSGDSTLLEVNTTLSRNVDRLARGGMRFNSATGEYFVSRGDNTIANEMAAAMTAPYSYAAAGGLSPGDMTLADYAATLVAKAANEAASTKSAAEYQQGLVDSLRLKDAEISQVSLDEELAQLLVFQQSYSAAGKVIAAIADMFDELSRIV